MRVSSVLFSLLVLSGTCMALTGGATHPDYYGFTPAGRSDFVSLPTGDFSYSVDLLEVPGPSLSYPVTLGYRAGITLEQQASWVGLGWNLCPGAITRTVNKSPDDYLAGHTYSYFEGENKAYDNDISGSISGVNAHVHWGDLGGFSFDVKFLNVIGIQYNEEGGLNPFWMPTTLYEFYTAAKSWFSHFIMQGYGPSSGDISSALSSVGIDLPSGVISLGIRSTMNTIQAGLVQASMYGAERSYSSGIRSKNRLQAFEPVSGLMATETETWISKRDDYNTYGYLNLGAFPKESIDDTYLGYDVASKEVIDKPCAFDYTEDCPEDWVPDEDCFSDENWITRRDKMEYEWAVGEKPTPFGTANDFNRIFEALLPRSSFAVATPDIYGVSGLGMSVSFRPYRRDIGDYFSTAGEISGYNPATFESVVEAYQTLIDPVGAIIKELTKCDPPVVDPTWGYEATLGEYATPFVDEYDETMYDEGFFGDMPVTIFKPSGEKGGSFESEPWPHECGQNGRSCSEYCSDCREWSQNVTWRKAIKARYISRNKTDRKSSLKSNSSLSEGSLAGAYGIFPRIETVEISGTQYKRMLTGFTIVGNDGLIYEYHQPVYSYRRVDRSVERPKWNEERFYAFGSIKAWQGMKRPFAYAWLLTSVKSPDYVDLGEKGPNRGDIGGWVRFEYDDNKRIPDYRWRIPYEGWLPTATGEDQPVHYKDENLFTFKSYGQSSCGAKEIRYLTDIFTETHHLQFELEDRIDGLQSGDQECGEGDGTDRKLQRIKMLRLAKNYNDDRIIDPEETTVKSVVFEYDYRLCPNAPNSVDRDGKLTLRTVLVSEGDKYLPPYEFSYYMEGDAARYHPLHWDRYGYYKHNGGLQKTEYELANVTDWQGMLEEMKNEDPEFSLSAMIRRQLLEIITPAEMDRLVAKNSHHDMTFREKGWVLSAINRVKDDPLLYSKLLKDDALYSHIFVGSLGKNELLAGNYTPEVWATFLDKLRNYEPGSDPRFYGLVRDYVNKNDGVTGSNTLMSILEKETADELNPFEKKLLIAAVEENRKQAFQLAKINSPNLARFFLWGRDELPQEVLDANLLFAEYTNLAKGDNPIFSDQSGTVQRALSDQELNMVKGFNAHLMGMAFSRSEKPYIRKSVRNAFDHDTEPEDVKAWSLKEVKSPTGGRLVVEYESDDYIYAGRSREMPHERILVDQNTPQDAAVYRNIGREKSSLSSTGNKLKKAVFEKLGENAYLRADDITIRVESLFRLYRSVSTENGEQVQLNRDFDTLRARHFAPKEPSYESENDLHLIAWIRPEWFDHWQGRPDETMIVRVGPQYDPFANAYDACGCGAIESVTWFGDKVINPNLIPVDLGAVALDFSYHGVSDEGATEEQKLQGFDREKFCQRNYVEFPLSKLRPVNWQGNTFEGGEHREDAARQEGYRCRKQCNVDEEIDFLSRVHKLSWARKRSIWAPDYGQVSPEPEPYGWFLDDGWRFGVNWDGRNDENCAEEVCLHTYSVDNVHSGGKTDPKIRIGNHAWVTLQESGAYNRDVVQSHQEADIDFFVRYWDFYSFNIYEKVLARTVTEQVGIPGGGLRTKRLTMTSGWEQQEGNAAKLRVVEYAYDNEGVDGAYTSGSIGWPAPPYGNAGDDRRSRPPESELLSVGPQVFYRRVAEIHPGRGRIVYDFMSPADIGDYFEQLPSVQDDGKDAYGVPSDGPYFWTPHKRFRLHRLSHLIGLPRRITVADSRRRVRMEKVFKYAVSLNQLQINAIAQISMTNNSDALGAIECLVPTIEANIEGKSYPALPNHTGLSADFSNEESIERQMGNTVQRYRHRWNYNKLMGTMMLQNEPDPRITIGINDFEEVEHGYQLHSVVTRRFEPGNRSKFVGVKETYEYFDYLTAEPLVVRNEEIRNAPDEGCVTCDQGYETEPNGEDNGPTTPAKTEVTVPAYWVPEYNKDAYHIRMGSVYEDNVFKSLAKGIDPNVSVSDLMNKNMLMQKFTNSIYENLPPFADNAAWREQLANRPTSEYPGKPLLKRSITTWAWEPFSPLDNAAWRIDGIYNLRIPMNEDRELTASPSIIGYPYVLEDRSVASQLLNNMYAGTPAYIVRQTNRSYDQWGNTLYATNANGIGGGTSYKDGYLKLMEISNAKAENCFTNQFDEIDDLSRPGWIHSGAQLTRAARSGTKALALGAQAHLLVPVNDLREPAREYEFSFWTTRPGGSVSSTGGKVDYDVNGPRWQRQAFSISPEQEIEYLGIRTSNGGVIIDDIRFAPADARVHTWTYNERDRVLSEEGPDGLIQRYEYDDLGRVVGTRDPEGLLIFTQDKVEAKTE